MADASFPTTLEVGSSFLARPTCVESPKNFYVMPLAHMKHFPSIEQPGRLMQKVPVLNDIVVFRSQIQNKFMRGQITHIDVAYNQCKIFTVDYGSTEECVEFKDLYRVPYKANKKQKPLAIHCDLFMCAPKGETFGDVAIDAFKFYLGQDENLRIKIKSVSGNKFCVEVRNSNPDDVATMLAITGYTFLGGGSNMGRRIKHIKQITWKHRQLKEGETLSVRLQLASNFSNLYVCTVDDFNDYLTKRKDFIEYCRYATDIDEENLVVGKAVGVKEKLDLQFERAIILEVLKQRDQVKVRLIDWGKEAIVPINRVKLIQTEWFSETPIRAIYCSAINAESFIEFLPKSLCVGYNYRITIKELGFEFDIPHLVMLA